MQPLLHSDSSWHHQVACHVKTIPRENRLSGCILFCCLDIFVWDQLDSEMFQVLLNSLEIQYLSEGTFENTVYLLQCKKIALNVLNASYGVFPSLNCWSEQTGLKKCLKISYLMDRTQDWGLREKLRSFCPRITQQVCDQLLGQTFFALVLLVCFLYTAHFGRVFLKLFRKLLSPTSQVLSLAQMIFSQFQGFMFALM